MSYAEYQQIVAVFGSNVFNPSGSFIIDAPAGVLLTGPSTILAGNSGQFTAAAFPVSDNGVTYELYNGDQKVPTQWDGQGNAYEEYNGVAIYEATGVVVVNPSIQSDVRVNVKAKITGTSVYSAAQSLLAQAITYPTSVVISGGASIDHNATYNYTKAFDTNNFTASVLSVAWSLSQNDCASLSNQSQNGVDLVVNNTPATLTTVTLTCTVTFTGNVTRTGTKQISMQLTTPSSLTISGPATLDDNGTFNYTKAFNTNNYTSTLLSVVWSLTSDQSVVIKSSDNNGAVLEIAEGNDTAKTLTLTCTATFTGNVTVTGTKSISVAVIEAPPTEDWVDLGLPSGYLIYRDVIRDGNNAVVYQSRYDSVATINQVIETSLGSGKCITNAIVSEIEANTDITEITKGENKYFVLTSKVNGNKLTLPEVGYYNSEPSKVYVNHGLGFISNYEQYSTKSYYLLSFSGVSGISFTTLLDNQVNSMPLLAVRKAPPKAIDLGLPSGLLWTDRNLGALSPTDYGEYFSWGNTDGHAEGSGYDFSAANYDASPGKQITGDIALSQDAANAYLGGSFRMPTKGEFQELYDNCDSAWVTENGVAGRRFTSKTNGNSIFFPAAGYYNGTTLGSRGSYGSYWSASRHTDSNGYNLGFNSGNVNPQNSYYRRCGFSVRAVQ
jgi:hypothetical protein